VRVVFMGTPEFATPSLQGLVEAGYEIALVVSQPNRPVGRSRQPVRPPVAEYACGLGLPLFQPTSLRPPEVFARLSAARPDVVVVAAYGLLLRREVLELPPLGCLNVHASLLPRHRGAAPVAAAILAGDSQTGVCIMQMEAGLDTGPVLGCSGTPIGADDDTPSLTQRLAKIGRDLLLETLPAWAAGEIAPQPQDQHLATYAPRIEREDARLDWSLPVLDLWRRARAYRGWPDAFTSWAGRQLKVLVAHPGPPAAPGTPAGQVVSAPDERTKPAVAASDGTLVLDLVVLEGSRATDGAAFLRGHRDFMGAQLGG